MSDTLDFRFGEIEIDMARRELRRGGEIVRVEPQVFDLLLLLIRHRDRVVTKDELIDAIWHGRIVSEAALSSCIKAARRALGDTGDDQAAIRTIYKRGFRFIGDLEGDGAAPAEAAERPDRPSTSDAPAPSAAPAGELALSLPSKPSIAVLPFTNMSGDPEQDYFADGLTEDIITGLSRQRWFFVIARNSSFAYKGEAIDVRKVSAQLGVRYVLEGSVRKAANRVRVTGQLIDAVHGGHLWADKYDRELADIFELQDDITNRVIGSVGPHILVAEAARLHRKPPQSLDAWDLVLQALPHLWRVDTAEHRLAQDLLQQAIALDSGYAHAHALLGWSHVSMFNLNPRTPIREFTEKALELGARAVGLDDEDPWGHLVLGLGHARRRRPEQAITHLSKSVDLNPQLRARPRRTRIRFGLWRRTGTRAGVAGTSASLQSARSVPGGLRADRAVHGAVRPRALRRGGCGVPRGRRDPPEPCRRLAADDGLARPSGQDRGGEGGARPDAHAAAGPVQRACRERHRVRGPGHARALSRGAAQSRDEELATAASPPPW